MIKLSIELSLVGSFGIDPLDVEMIFVKNLNVCN